MTGAQVEHDLAQRLDALRKTVGDTVPVEQVGDLVRAILAGVGAAGDLQLYRELEALARYIHEAKLEIASLRPQDADRYFANAADELDAIVEATENATNNILDAAEQIEGLMAEVSSEAGETLTAITTQIYESCNFQDITGQRITKVVKALKHIEEKIDALVAAFGEDIARARRERDDAAAARPAQPLGDADLLNGPQLPASARKQDEIDALLASFD